MNKYIDIEIFEENQIEKVLSTSLKINSEDFRKTIETFKFNTNPILKNWDKFNNFLLMGDVQSGKTNNLIYLAYNLFLAKKVDIIFYLTGTNNELLNQNQERFFDAFRELKNDFYIYTNKNLDSKILEDNSKIIINSLKTTHRLDQIKELIEENSNKIRYLLIDDEADDVSTSDKTFKMLSYLTNKDNVKYIGITATPFRNLYKMQDFYDYFHILHPGIGYQGLSIFNKQLKVYNNDSDKILMIAFIEWIIKTALSNKKNSQILINIINLNVRHYKIFKKLQNILNDLKNFRKLKGMIHNNFPDKLKYIDVIKKFIDKLKSDIFKINNGEFNEEPKNIGYEVIIGGIKLSRGITYKNLTSAVMINMGSKEIDPCTLIQRARWLGYGKNLDEIDIYVNRPIEKALLEAEELLKMTKDFTLNDGKYKDKFNQMKYKWLKLK